MQGTDLVVSQMQMGSPEDDPSVWGSGLQLHHRDTWAVGRLDSFLGYESVPTSARHAFSATYPCAAYNHSDSGIPSSGCEMPNTTGSPSTIVVTRYVSDAAGRIPTISPSTRSFFSSMQHSPTPSTDKTIGS